MNTVEGKKKRDYILVLTCIKTKKETIKQLKDKRAKELEKVIRSGKYIF